MEGRDAVREVHRRADLDCTLGEEERAMLQGRVAMYLYDFEREGPSNEEGSVM